jgi:hypothetical protein
MHWLYSVPSALLQSTTAVSAVSAVYAVCHMFLASSASQYSKVESRELRWQATERGGRLGLFKTKARPAQCMWNTPKKRGSPRNVASANPMDWSKELRWQAA